MANKRRPTQKSLGIYVEEELLDILDAYLPKARISKSQFIRDAIFEKLQKANVEIKEELILPSYKRTKPNLAEKPK